MASNHTSNYGLCQWEATDQVLRTEFNEDNRKIDTALEMLAKQTEGKAEQSGLDALSQALSQKADQSALNAEISARTAADSELQKKAGMQLIRRVTLSQQESWPKLDLSDIDWNQWAAVRIVMKPVSNSEEGYRTSLNFSDSSEGFSTDLHGHFHMILQPTFDPDMIIIGHFWPPFQGTNDILLDNTFRTIESIEFGIAHGEFLSGTVMEAWGNK